MRRHNPIADGATRPHTCRHDFPVSPLVGRGSNPGSQRRNEKKAGAVVNFSSTHTLKSYESASQPVIVDATDVTGVNVELKESKTIKKDLDMNEWMIGPGAN
jgi:hypothetical protein